MTTHFLAGYSLGKAIQSVYIYTLFILSTVLAVANSHLHQKLNRHEHTSDQPI